MTEDLFRLGQRATKCKRWKWMPGMYVPVHGILMDVGKAAGEERALIKRRREPELYWVTITYDWVPDLSDAATLGLLIQRVREAHGMPSLHTRYDVDDGWYMNIGAYLVRADTEAAVFVRALEAAL